MFINQNFCFKLTRNQSANPQNLTPKLFLKLNEKFVRNNCGHDQSVPTIINWRSLSWVVNNFQINLLFTSFMLIDFQYSPYYSALAVNNESSLTLRCSGVLPGKLLLFEDVCILRKLTSVGSLFWYLFKNYTSCPPLIITTAKNDKLVRWP